MTKRAFATWAGRATAFASAIAFEYWTGIRCVSYGLPFVATGDLDLAALSAASAGAAGNLGMFAGWMCVFATPSPDTPFFGKAWTRALRPAYFAACLAAATEVYVARNVYSFRRRPAPLEQAIVAYVVAISAGYRLRRPRPWTETPFDDVAFVSTGLVVAAIAGYFTWVAILVACIYGIFRLAKSELTTASTSAVINVLAAFAAFGGGAAIEANGDDRGRVAAIFAAVFLVRAGGDLAGLIVKLLVCAVASAGLAVVLQGFSVGSGAATLVFVHATHEANPQRWKDVPFSTSVSAASLVLTCAIVSNTGRFDVSALAAVLASATVSPPPPPAAPPAETAPSLKIVDEAPSRASLTNAQKRRKARRLGYRREAALHMPRLVPDGSDAESDAPPLERVARRTLPPPITTRDLDVAPRCGFVRSFASGVGRVACWFPKAARRRCLGDAREKVEIGKSALPVSPWYVRAFKFVNDALDAIRNGFDPLGPVGTEQRRI